MRRRTAFQISGAVQLRRRTFSQPPSRIRFARRVRHRRVRAPSSTSRMKSDNNVSVIDTATNMVVATVPMGDDPRGVAVTLTGNKPVTPRTLATPDALGLKTRDELARHFRREIWINRESVTRLAKAARQARFGDACPSWQRRLSTDFAPSPVISSTPGRRYREELPAR